MFIDGKDSLFYIHSHNGKHYSAAVKMNEILQHAAIGVNLRNSMFRKKMSMLSKDTEGIRKKKDQNQTLKRYNF